MSFCCLDSRRDTDKAKACFRLACGSTDNEIWVSNGLVNPCATLIFNLEQACDTSATGGVNITINQTNGNTIQIDNLLQGESRTITVDRIDSITADCLAGTDNDGCILFFCMLIHYDCC